MIRLGTSSARYDPVENLGTAILRQAMFDLEKTSPARTAKIRALVDEPGISSDLRCTRRWRWGEASDMREELLEWLGSPDFATVVEWSGFEIEGVKKAFDAVLAAQGAGSNEKRKRRRA